MASLSEPDRADHRRPGGVKDQVNSFEPRLTGLADPICVLFWP